MHRPARRRQGDNGVPANGNETEDAERQENTNMKCQIKRCTEIATVLTILDRPASAATAGGRAWHGHMEASYCETHAVARPAIGGVVEFGDVWTLRPLSRVA